jgi:hypothetical protein
MGAPIMSTALERRSMRRLGTRWGEMQKNKRGTSETKIKWRKRRKGHYV